MGDTVHLLCETNEECLNWWAHDLNKEALYLNIRTHAHKLVFWRCPICSTVFEKEVCHMVGPYGPVCPSCSEKRKRIRAIEASKLEKTPISSIPELLSAWDDERDPSKIMVISHPASGSYDDRVFRFKCPNGHHPRIEPYTFLKNGCPFCNSRTKQFPNTGYIQDEWPELAAEWGNGNGKYTSENTRYNSERLIMWKCLVCGHEWKETPRNRTREYSACCPKCGKVLGSLWWKYPEIAKEWDPNNMLPSWQVRKQTRFIPQWICANNPDHRWKSNITTRINGSDCPFCTDSRKSRTELLFFEAAKRVFPTAKSGITITSQTFSHPWTVDILVITNSMKIAIEFDGLYWHSKRENQDTQKSLELLKDGFSVFRLRETGLTPLQIVDSHYFEISVNPLTVRKDAIFKSINEILNSSTPNN